VNEEMKLWDKNGKTLGWDTMMADGRGLQRLWTKALMTPIIYTPYINSSVCYL
jgi:hypothetical protein